ncbi:FtsH protease activity modulator HflK [uncultured Thiothrix sp.]|jgi:membrane protease subunit HflK|uniref:FtsH protease activity modulator HflK n=1 Tax=uncultured Thiothrix sp. TaxID=223185 RepID=UPI002631A573|nr:FtsH protease activity modulator HflK [uncultured Thiothrix sp.]HMT93573.1 FtsH protease activity modulator HflK [Thiolinea sp.]
MPWNEPGGNNQDPWTGKNKTTNKSTDTDELVRKLNQKLSGLFGKKPNSSSEPDGPPNYKGIFIILGVLVAGWLFSGFYMVDAREQALVLRFGAYQSTSGPGLHWHLPTPIETIEYVDVAQNRSAQDTSNMLTQDENIVEIAVTAQYQVSDAEDYTFNVFRADDLANQAQGTLYQAMRSATREVIGRSKMDYILGEGREQIAVETQKLMQTILDNYKVGLRVIKVNLTYAEAPDAVKDAFDDANRAREDANRFQNEAETYSNKVVPDARGEASRLSEEAIAYRDQAIARAEGDAARFTQLVTEYKKAPDVTRERLYLEAMESVMTGSRKVLVTSENSNNMLYIPIDPKATTMPTELSPAALASAASATINGNESSNSSNGVPSTETRQQRPLSPGQTRESRQ